jgi:hypothetical protein
MFDRLSVQSQGLTGASAGAVSGDSGGAHYTIDQVAGTTITDPAGTVCSDGGCGLPYGTTNYSGFSIQAEAGKEVVVTLQVFEMGDTGGPGGRSTNEKLRIFNGQEGLRYYYGSGTRGDVPLGEQTTSPVGGTLTIIQDVAGYYGAGGFYGTDDIGFEITWETI